MRTYVSTYIKKADMLKDKKDKELEMAKADIAQLEADIRMFSSKIRKITNDLTKPRPKEKESIHVEYARNFGLSSYFVINLERAGKGITESAREILKLNIENQKDKISQMGDKIKTLEKQIKNANKIKDSLIERSKAKKKWIALLVIQIRGISPRLKIASTMELSAFIIRIIP